MIGRSVEWIMNGIACLAKVLITKGKNRKYQSAIEERD